MPAKVSSTPALAVVASLLEPIGRGNQRYIKPRLQLAYLLHSRMMEQQITPANTSATPASGTPDVTSGSPTDALLRAVSPALHTAATAYLRQLAALGFAPPVLVEREPNGFLDLHTHPFEARAFILEGEIELNCAGATTRYAPGTQFHLQNEEPHTERYGPGGVRYWSARK